MMKLKNILISVITILLGGTACSKMSDPVKPFIEEGEIIYSTKVDSLKSFSGRNRALLQWKLPVNHSMKLAWAFWNNGKDSVELNVRAFGDRWYQSEVAQLKEGTYLFDVYTEDEAGNRSIKTLTSVNVYGKIYESTLLNRAFVSAIVNSLGNVVVEFTLGEAREVETTIQYTDQNDISREENLQPDETTVTLLRWKEGTPIRYRTRFIPSLSAIDTVSVPDMSNISVKKDITANYLKNYQRPFLSVQSTGRFRDPLDWTVNSTVQNHNSMGGWSSDDGTVLAMESGWGSPNIINGKIYQTFVLPKGDYSIEVDLGGNGIAASKVKIVAVQGSLFPDFDKDFQVKEALATADLLLGRVRFANPTDGPVTIGFIATMTGDQYWRMSKISLYKYF